MHQSRQFADWKLPIERKGNKYVVRASSHVNDSVPVLIAIRDMLKIARDAREVKEMIKAKSLKVNGKIVLDYHQSIKLFNLLEADKKYELSLLPTKRFFFKEHKGNERLCKVMSRKLLSGNKIQLNLHDGTNVMSSQKIAVGDSVYVDSSTKITKHITLEKGKSVFIFLGKYAGLEGKIESIDGKKVNVKLKEKTVELSNREVVAN